SSPSSNGLRAIDLRHRAIVVGAPKLGIAVSLKCLGGRMTRTGNPAAERHRSGVMISWRRRSAVRSATSRTDDQPYTQFRQRVAYSEREARSSLRIFASSSLVVDLRMAAS